MITTATVQGARRSLFSRFVLATAIQAYHLSSKQDIIRRL